MRDFLSNTSAPWRWSQEWRDVLFTHWQVAPAALQSRLPIGLVLDTWGGMGWISIVAFRLRNIRFRNLPTLGLCSNFLEINLRTYVRYHDEPAICFLSLHASTRLAVGLARWFTPLPYAFARIAAEWDRPGCRIESTSPSGTGDLPLFRAEFVPSPGEEQPVEDGLDRWLLERYCAYGRDKRGTLFRMAVRHPPWEIRPATLEVCSKGMGEKFGLDLDRQPDRWQVSAGVQAYVWPFVAVRSS